MQARARDSANVVMCASVTKAAVMMHDENMLQLGSVQESFLIYLLLCTECIPRNVFVNIIS